MWAYGAYPTALDFIAYVFGLCDSFVQLYQDSLALRETLWLFSGRKATIKCMVMAIHYLIPKTIKHNNAQIACIIAC